MALEVVWTENALIHLEDILYYWDKRNKSNAYSKRLYKLFQNELDLLSRYPDIGTKTNNKIIQKKSVRDYFVYYSCDDTFLTVLGIVDMRRNPTFIKKFEE